MCVLPENLPCYRDARQSLIYSTKPIITAEIHPVYAKSLPNILSLLLVCCSKLAATAKITAGLIAGEEARLRPAIVGGLWKQKPR